MALALGWALAQTGPGQRLEGLLFDRAAPLLGRDRPVESPIVVLIGEADYNQAATPMALWGLRLAPFLDTLAQAGPKAVGLDLVLPRFPLARLIREHDRVFMKSLKKLSKKTRLVSGYGISPDGTIRGPFTIYRRILGPKGYGYFNLTPDKDGICRAQLLSLPGTGETPLFSFAALVAGREPAPRTSFTPDWRNPAQVKTLTFAQAREADPALFKGRVVLVGVDFEFEDRHRSPTSEKEEPGVIFQAQVVEGLLSGQGLTDPGPFLSVLLPALAMVLIMLLLPASFSPLRAGLTGLGLAAALVAVALAALAGGWIIKPVAGFFVVAAFSIFRLIYGYFFTRKIFGQYVEPDVRDEILSGRIPLDGEMKEATLLFCDLRNFTPLVESSSIKEVVRILNGYYKEMSGAIRENGGLVMQYVGDEVYAAFGAPVPNPDQARQAVRAGLEMRRRLTGFNQVLKKQGKPPLAHGIGIHTGTVLAANIGGGDRLSYALVGDAVNLASRLEGLNKQFDTTMIISGAIKDRIEEGPDFNLRALPPTEIKGKTKPVDLFEVVLSEDLDQRKNNDFGGQTGDP